MGSILRDATPSVNPTAAGHLRGISHCWATRTRRWTTGSCLLLRGRESTRMGSSLPCCVSRAQHLGLGGSLPFFMRWRMLKNMAKNWRGPTPGQASDIETTYLRMRLDHDSGELDGTVLRGSFSGRQLSELAQADLMVLLQEWAKHCNSKFLSFQKRIRKF